MMMMMSSRRKMMPSTMAAMVPVLRPVCSVAAPVDAGNQTKFKSSEFDGNQTKLFQCKYFCTSNAKREE